MIQILLPKIGYGPSEGATIMLDGNPVRVTDELRDRLSVTAKILITRCIHMPGWWQEEPVKDLQYSLEILEALKNEEEFKLSAGALMYLKKRFSLFLNSNERHLYMLEALSDTLGALNDANDSA